MLNFYFSWKLLGDIIKAKGFNVLRVRASRENYRKTWQINYPGGNLLLKTLEIKYGVYYTKNLRGLWGLFERKPTKDFLFEQAIGYLNSMWLLVWGHKNLWDMFIWWKNSRGRSILQKGCVLFLAALCLFFRVLQPHSKTNQLGFP